MMSTVNQKWSPRLDNRHSAESLPRNFVEGSPPSPTWRTPLRIPPWLHDRGFQLRPDRFHRLYRRDLLLD